MDQFLVLIADIQSSKDVKEEQREALQQKLQKELNRLNKRGNPPVSPYTITLGDEFQAVFERADDVFVDLIRILSVLYPVKARFSLATGSIDTSINTEQAIGMDGPAFHRARRGMEVLKESGFLFNLTMEGKQPAALDVINNSLQLLSHEIDSWQKNRLAILHMINEGHDYKAITQKLEISRPAFYKNKEAGALDVISELMNNISVLINEELKA